MLQPRLPRTKYSNQVIDGYAPAPLDNLSIENGVRAFLHHQHTYPSSFLHFALYYLNVYFPLLSRHSGLISDDVIISHLTSAEHRDTTSGYPFREFGAPTKGQAFTKFGLSYIRNVYYEIGTLIGMTLKDEPRPVGKDARALRPQDVSSYVIADELFFNQNEYFVTAPNSPIMAKYSSPGTDLASMYARLVDFCGDNYDSDAHKWDATFNLATAAIICEFRCLAAPLLRDRIEDYYGRIYNGRTLVCGRLVPLIGQASGHYNTTVDNSLGHIINMLYHCYKYNVSPIQGIRYYVCGDDLIWSDRTGAVTPRLLSETYAELGQWLEFTSADPLPITSLHFCGTLPIYKMVHGVRVLTYTYDSQRLLPKSKFFKKDASALDVLQKLCAFAQLLYNSEYFDTMVNCVNNYLNHSIDAGTLSLNSDVIGSLHSISPIALDAVYFRFE